MYNLRYHLASLVAVFLALALGLVLGGIVGQSGLVSRQRTALVQGLRSDFKKLSTQNADLQTQLTLQQQLSNSLVDQRLSGKLATSTVLLISNTGQVNAVNSAADAVKAAGGDVVVVRLSKPGFGLSDPAVARAVSALMGPAAGKDVAASVASSLAAEWTTDGPRPLTDVLRSHGVIDGAEPATGTVGTAAVVLAGFNNHADPGSVALGRALADRHLWVVAAQEYGSANGMAQAAAAKGISAMDTLGTLPGRYTLVMLLSGSAEGFYGVGEGAKATFPPLPATP